MALSLKKLDCVTGRKGPLLLIVMDGIGIGSQDDSNAVYMAETPSLDRLFSAPLYTRLQAHGMAVGQPSDDLPAKPLAFAQHCSSHWWSKTESSELCTRPVRVSRLSVRPTTDCLPWRQLRQP